MPQNMVQSPSALAYLPDARDVVAVFDNWPSDMELALFLEPSGQSTAIPYHHAERDTITQRLAEIFDLEMTQIAVFPPVKGCPALPLRYSDEQRLFSILTANKSADVVDKAKDYALNYQFACDEGLDQSNVVGRVRVALTEKEEPTPEERAKTEGKQTSSTSVSGDRPEETPSEASQQADDDLPNNATETGGTLVGSSLDSKIPAPILQDLNAFETQLCRDGAYVVLRPKNAETETRTIPENAVFIRDDQKAFAVTLPTDLLEGGSVASVAFHIPIESLPASLCPQNGQSRSARAWIKTQKLYVVVFEQIRPDLPDDQAEAPEVANKPTSSPMPRVSVGHGRMRRWSRRVFMLGLPILLLLSGSMALPLS